LDEAKEVREKHNLPNHPRQTPEDAMKMHDFMVSLWAGRMGFTGQVKKKLETTASTV
jgi:hypothetical protein